MIEQALYEHLLKQKSLFPFLAVYNGQPAIFNQEAPSDVDDLWNDGPQYGRLVFAVDLQGDPERIMGGTLVVDIMCKEDEQFPEDIEPIVKDLIHGYFFSNGTFTTAAQWKNSSYFTQPTDHVTGCTVAFDLLGFPVLTTSDPDVIERINAWTSESFPMLHVINYEALPAAAWKPEGEEAAVYWRMVTDDPAGWIPDTFQTIWRTANLKCHVFSEDFAAAADAARGIVFRLYAVKRLMKQGEAPIMVNRRNRLDLSADPLRAGQIAVEATYGVIVQFANENHLQGIRYDKN